ncbi:MAG TPA: tripartite tricarboxylate transporter substrate-binding protein, partial [Burkholderiaceae bacterium]|nr:tripartite tricarboxylate transporter substrate-binding protein [Burkholderiaceae bacterium]
LERLGTELQAALRRPEVRARMASLGFEPLPGRPSALAALMRDERQAWSAVVRTQGLKVD